MSRSSGRLRAPFALLLTSLTRVFGAASADAQIRVRATSMPDVRPLSAGQSGGRCPADTSRRASR